MRCVLAVLALLIAAPAWGDEGDLVLPKVEFAATDVQQTGAFLRRETIHYAHGRLRIDRGEGFATTILDLTTQTDCELMVNHTYLVLPMDDELYRRFVPHTVAMSASRKIGAGRMEGLPVTKYAFGDDGALRAAGFYWLTDSGIMLRREYDDGVFGRNVHHVEYLTHLVFAKQPASLFEIPAGYTPAR
jgi:hypothetical protein